MGSFKVFTTCFDEPVLDDIPYKNERLCEQAGIDFIRYNKEMSLKLLDDFPLLVTSYNNMNSTYQELVAAYMALYLHGGLYVKKNCLIKSPKQLINNICGRPHYSDKRYVMLVKSRTYINSICSSAMFFKPGDKFLLYIISKCEEIKDITIPRISFNIGSEVLGTEAKKTEREIDYMEWHELFGNSKLVEKNITNNLPPATETRKDVVIFWIGMPAIIVFSIIILILSWRRDTRILFK